MTNQSFRLVILTIVCVLYLSGTALAAQPEFRAAWVTGWQSGFLTPEQADNTIKAAKAAGLNALFVQARKVGDALYESSYEARAPELKSAPRDYDPLAYMIKKAHEQGIEVHAWVVVYRVWVGSKKPSNPNHIVNKHPEWLTRTRDGKVAGAGGYIWADPGNPELADYTAKVFMEIVRKYDIDGLHFDYIRYDSSAHGYNKAAVARFNSETGRTGLPDPKDPAWSDWRRKQISDFVRRMYTEATAVKPNIKMTASVYHGSECPEDFTKSGPYRGVLQDWAGWMRDGILDATVVMNYKNEANPKQAAEFRAWINGAVRWRYGRHAYIGQMVRDTKNTLQQSLASRKRGADGFSLFHFNTSAGRTKLVEAMSKDLCREKVSVPDMPWKKQGKTDAQQ